MVTGLQLQRVFPNTPIETLNASADQISAQAPAWSVNTTRRLAAFIAQAGYESQAFLSVTENLNYSAQGLLATFPTHFTPAEAAAYAHQPERIANRAYANRMGNGSEASGDGWRFRGRGWFQVTGRDNYFQFATTCRMSIDQVVQYMQTMTGVCHSAMWYYNAKKLNNLADAGLIDDISVRINGGRNGLQDRHSLYTKLLNIL